LEQIEFANVIILNKTDLVEPQDVGIIKAFLKEVNPEAEIISSTFGKVDLKKVLNTGKFSVENAKLNPGWLKESRGTHKPESEEYGISSFVFFADRPFHPVRFHNFLHESWSGVLRAKGFFWLASRIDQVGVLAQAGVLRTHEGAGTWWAATPRTEWPSDSDERAEIEKNWHPIWGDRHQEIVFIGHDMNREELTAKLNDCLLNDNEMSMGVRKWTVLPDPFPAWTVETTESVMQKQ
jgi:G3E family GTPase